MMRSTYGKTLTSAAAIVIVGAVAGMLACADATRPVVTPPVVTDTVPPTLAITSPIASGSTTTTEAQVVVAGMASDNIGVVSIRWSNSAGGSGVTSGTTAWSATIPLQMGDNALTFTAEDGATKTATATITVTRTAVVKPPAQLALTTPPSPTAANRVAFAQQPVVQLRDTSGDAVSLAGVTVTAAIGSGGGTLGGAVTATTDSTGAARFADLSISGTTGARTLSFAAGLLTAATSSPIGITAGTPASLVVSNIATQVSGAPFSVTATLVDADNNTTSNTGAAATVALTRQTGTGTLGGTTGGTFAVGDSSTLFSGVTYTGVETGVSLLVTSSGPGSSANGTTGTTNAFSILAAPDVTPPTLAIATPTTTSTYATTSSQITIGGTASDNLVVTVVKWSNDRGGSGTATGTTNWSASVALQPGVNVLTVRAEDGSNNATAATLTVASTVPNPPTQLALTRQPAAAAQSGVVFTAQPVIELRDASGAGVAQAGVTVTASIATGDGTLAGTTAATTNASGVATFTDLSIAGTIGNRTLSFTSGTLTAATSNPVSVAAGAAARLLVAAIGSQAAIVPFSVTISLVDATNNAVNNSGSVGTVILSRRSGTGTLGGTVSGSLPVGSNVLTIAGVTYSVAESGVSVTAMGEGSGSDVNGKMATSNVFAVTTGPDVTPPTIVITTPTTASTFATTATQITVGGTAADNIAVTAVHWTNDRGGSGTATGTTNWSASIALQPGVNVLTVRAEDGANNTTNATLTVTSTVPKPATQLTLSTQPSATANSGVAFPAQPVVQLRDVDGAAVAQTGVVVTAAIATGGGTVGGTITATTDATGVATFTDLSIAGTIGSRVLSFSAGTLTAATSNAVSVIAGPAAKLVIAPIGTQVMGVAFNVTVSLVDANDNAADNSGAAGTITLSRATGTGSLAGTISGNFPAGASSITINTLTYTVAELGVTLTATGSGSGSDVNGKTATSNPFSVGTLPDVVPPTVAITAPTSASSFATTSNQITIGGTATDNVGVSALRWTNDRGGSGTATGTTTWSASIALQPGVNVITVRAEDASNNATTATLTVTSTNPPTQLAITTQPSANANSGAAFTTQPIVQLRDASGTAVAQAGVTVTAAIATGGGALGGSTVVTTNASGVATFTDLSIVGTIGARTINFTSSTLTAATSDPVNVAAGVATKLLVAAIGTQTVGAPFNVTISLADANNNAVNNSGSAGTITLSRATGSGILGGTVSATFAVGMSTTTISGATYSVAESGVSLVATGSGGGSGVAGLTATSNAFAVNGATQLGVTTQPSTSAANGMAFATQPVVQLRDANGALIAQAGVSVTATIAGGGGVLGGTVTVMTDARGSAAFTSLSIAGTVGTRTLRFSSNGLAGATSTDIALTAGPVAKLVISPVTDQKQNTAFSVAVGLYDANDNLSTNAGAAATITLSRASGTGTIGGTTTGTVPVDQSGVVISGVTYSVAESGVMMRATGGGTGSAIAGMTATSNAFAVAAVGGCASHNYATTFPATEFPISEGGCWVNGATDGIDWSDVFTTPGRAMGNQTGRTFTDGTALLKGAWGSDQDVSATVFSAEPLDENCFPEVEFRLRSAIASHTNVGYEISHKVSSTAEAYLIVVRWNGTVGDFNYLFNQKGAQYGVRDGDVVRATINGNTISVYKNGTLETTVDITSIGGTTFSSGAPGIGFNLESGNGSQCSGKNNSYGFSRFSASDGTP